MYPSTVLLEDDEDVTGYSGYAITEVEVVTYGIRDSDDDVSS
jgi:hypothetical protein